MNTIDKAIAWWTDEHENNYDHYTEVREAVESLGLVHDDSVVRDILRAANDNRKQVEKELIKRRLKC